jgi:hypothetical protein
MDYLKEDLCRTIQKIDVLKEDRLRIMMRMYVLSHGSMWKHRWNSNDNGIQIDDIIPCWYCTKRVEPYRTTMYVPRSVSGSDIEVHVKCFEYLEKLWFTKIMLIFKEKCRESGWKSIYQRILPYIRFNIIYGSIR